MKLDMIFDLFVLFAVNSSRHLSSWMDHNINGLQILLPYSRILAYTKLDNYLQLEEQVIETAPF